MEKRKVLLFAFSLLVALISLFMSLEDEEDITKWDNIKFKEEYESLNAKTKGETGELYKEVIVPSENPIIYAKYSEIEKIITSGTGVIYFGFPECPWCRTMVPVLLDAAQEVGLDKIYYFNALSIRDKKHLNEDGEIVTDKEGTIEYNKLVKLLYDYLEEYEGLNDPSIKRLYFPTVVFVKDGQIIGVHIGTVDSHNSVNNYLNKTQYNELKDIYSVYMLNVLGNICSDSPTTKC